MEKKADKDGKIEGEGSYSATRAYNEATARFVEKGKSEQAAKDAERALEGPEGAELKAAEDEGRAGDPRHIGSASTGSASTGSASTEPGSIDKPPAAPKPTRSKSKAKSK